MVWETLKSVDYNYILFFILSSADFFSKLTFSKKSFRNIIRVSNSLDPDQAPILSGLTWVQTVNKGYQQATLVGKELKLKNMKVCLRGLFIMRS